MKRIDTLVIKELMSPWIFGVALFSALIFSAGFLMKLTDLLVNGAPFAMVIEMVLLILPGILAKTFAMAMLLASLLAFGRLSSDSEIVSMRAGGASVYRMVAPVGVFSLCIAVVAFIINEGIVPPASSRFQNLQTELIKKVDAKAILPASQNIVVGNRLKGVLAFQKLDVAAGIMRNVTVVAYGENGEPNAYLFAKAMEFDALRIRQGEGWHIRGGATLMSADGSLRTQINDDIWPSEIPRLSTTPTDIFAGNLKDLDALSMAQLKRAAEEGRRTGNITSAQIANLEYGYWNKIALPLGALVFGLLGAPLGIRSHRTSTASGFALSIGIIFGYLMIANWMSVVAQGGQLPAWAASFTPLAIGCMAAVVVMFRRDR